MIVKFPYSITLQNILDETKVIMKLVFAGLSTEDIPTYTYQTSKVVNVYYINKLLGHYFVPKSDLNYIIYVMLVMYLCEELTLSTYAYK